MSDPYTPGGWIAQEAYGDEVWELACLRHNTDEPNEDQLCEADLELREAWSEWHREDL